MVDAKVEINKSARRAGRKKSLTQIKRQGKLHRRLAFYLFINSTLTMLLLCSWNCFGTENTVNKQAHSHGADSLVEGDRHK